MTKRVVVVLALISASLSMATPAFAPCHNVGFDPSSYTVSEGAGKVTLSISNGAGAQSEDMMVTYATSNGTAKAPGDYTAENGTATFAEGGTSIATFDVAIKNDSTDEPSESFTVKISDVRPPSSCIPPPEITDDTATVTITDNDPKPQPSTSSAPTRSSSPRPTASRTPTPTSSATQSSSASPTVSPTPTPTSTQMAVAVADEGDGGTSGGLVAGIVAAAVVLGGAGAFVIRRRFLT